MYTALSIQDFRGIGSLSINDLARVNVFVGPNSVGKTTVLEAIWLLRGAGNPTLPMALASKRGTQPVLVNAPDSHWQMMFRNLDLQRHIRVVGTFSTGDSEFLRMEARPGSGETPIAENGQPAHSGAATNTFSPIGTTENLPIQFRMIFGENGSDLVTSTIEISNDAVQESGNPRATRRAVLLSGRSGTNITELADRFTQCDNRNRLPEVIDAVRIVEPTLEDLSLGYSSIGNRPIIYMRSGGVGHMVPFDVAGGGGRKILELLVSVLSEDESPIMIDELENGLYYENLPKVWRALDRSSQRTGCQLFVTTHSIECVRAAIEAMRESAPYDLRIFRLESSGGSIRVVDYSFEVAEAAVFANLEMR